MNRDLLLALRQLDNAAAALRRVAMATGDMRLAELAERAELLIAEAQESNNDRRRSHCDCCN